MYTFIAYKSSSSYYQLRDTGNYFPSDLNYKNNLSRNEIVDLLKHYHNHTTVYGENGYDIIVLFKGEEIIRKDHGKDYEITCCEDELRELSNNILYEIIF